MKRYEKFNQDFNGNDNAEIQSFEMIIAQIEEMYGLNLDWCGKKYKAQLKWLYEEVE